MRSCTLAPFQGSKSQQHGLALPLVRFSQLQYVCLCVCVCIHQQPLSLCCLGVGELLHVVSWELCGVM